MRSGKRVSARHTTIPLRTKGTEAIAQVPTTESTPLNDQVTSKRIESWIARQTGIEIANRIVASHIRCGTRSSGNSFGAR